MFIAALSYIVGTCVHCGSPGSIEIIAGGGSPDTPHPRGSFCRLLDRANILFKVIWTHVCIFPSRQTATRRRRYSLGFPSGLQEYTTFWDVVEENKKETKPNQAIKQKRKKANSLFSSTRNFYFLHCFLVHKFKKINKK